MDRTEENRQEYKELQHRVKREVSKAKQKAYDELYTRLDTREGEKDLYRLSRQRDRDGKDVQQVRVIKHRDGRVLTSEESVQRRWKEYFEELMNEENEREKRVEGVNSVEQKKLIIDEKKFYLFGRNPDICDFTIDHQSCSRVHAALVYHKHLKRLFLIDLNSTHGTFLGHIRLEPHKPQQVPIDSTMSFGASTRVYIIREKPQSQANVSAGDKTGDDEELKGLLGLPEEETELEKKKMESGNVLGIKDTAAHHAHSFPMKGGLYGDLPPAGHEAHAAGGTMLGGLPLPNPAPEVDLAPDPPLPPIILNPTPVTGPYAPEGLSEPRKKKYAKEAWPGKKPTPSLLL
ncbi:hypothetical protein QTP70_004592 [Hemibagrus guttatus]|uniref:FHA domain-containing protein n=1 Tax=Hemibagrus guttatus TaxID=175788 RepID=A0AAE0RD36_9TELE|nr:hypothetical protein QTP70_004592 [Hemibagrus guttatus]